MRVAFCFTLIILSQRQSSFAFPSEEGSFSHTELEKKKCNFRIAAQQERSMHNFTLKNVPTGIVANRSTKTPCGTNSALLSSIDVSPGATEAIKTEVALEPDFVNFGEVERGKTFTKILKLIQIGTKDLHLKKVEAAEDYFVTRVSPNEEKGQRGFKINVVLKPDAPVGLFVETIILHTNSNKKPRIDVPIYGNVIGRIRIKPQTVLLGVIEKGSHAANKIEVTSVDRKKFNILKVTFNPSYCLTEVTRAKNNWEFEIAIKVDENASTGRVAGKIHIYTDDSDQPLIEVPVYGLITNPVIRQTLKTKLSSEVSDSQDFKHIYITQPPIEGDTYISAWLIKRFLDPIAEFVFVPIGSLITEKTGCIFDLPSPYARWMRTYRRCTSEQVLAEIKEPDPVIKKMVGLVRQLEMASWLVSATSDAGRLRSTITRLTEGTTDPQLRVNRVFTYLDDIYAAGGYVSQ